MDGILAKFYGTGLAAVMGKGSNIPYSITDEAYMIEFILTQTEDMTVLECCMISVVIAEWIGIAGKLFLMA